MSRFWILDAGHELIPTSDALVWADWFETHHESDQRIVGRYVHFDTGVVISTVFLGIDHAFAASHQEHRPIVFESMVFGATDSEGEEIVWRYCTWAEAKEGHDQLVRLWTSGALRVTEEEQ